MQKRTHSLSRDRVLRKMEAMRMAKDRLRIERAAEGWTQEPKMRRWYPLELGLRDKATGEVAWVDFRGIRDASRRLAVVRRHYSPGIQSRL